MAVPSGDIPAPWPGGGHALWRRASPSSSFAPDGGLDNDAVSWVANPMVLTSRADTPTIGGGLGVGYVGATAGARFGGWIADRIQGESDRLLGEAPDTPTSSTSAAFTWAEASCSAG